MALGAGKYDEECTLVRDVTGAEGALIVVIGGRKGNGFSAQLTGPLLNNMPDMLESMAAQIRSDAGGELTQTASMKVDRWDFMMKALGNEHGPEDTLLTEIANDMMDDPSFKQRPASEQLTIVIDRAMAETAKNG